MSIWTVLVFLLALGIPIFLLYRFRSQSWYWHVIAIVIAMALGFLPMPPALRSQALDLFFAALLVALMVWGIGGLIVFRPPHKEKHA